MKHYSLKQIFSLGFFLAGGILLLLTSLVIKTDNLLGSLGFMFVGFTIVIWAFLKPCEDNRSKLKL